jgi:hypothetical protein
MGNIHSAAATAVMLKGAEATHDDVRKLMQGQSNAVIAAVLQKHQQAKSLAADAEDIKLYVKDHIRAYTFSLVYMVIGVLVLQLIILAKLFL